MNNFFLDQFIYTMKYIIEHGTMDERLLVVTTIWKMLANNYKTKHSIKSSSILQKCAILKRSLSEETTNDTVGELLHTINVLESILNK